MPNHIIIFYYIQTIWYLFYSLVLDLHIIPNIFLKMSTTPTTTSLIDPELVHMQNILFKEVLHSNRINIPEQFYGPLFNNGTIEKLVKTIIDTNFQGSNPPVQMNLSILKCLFIEPDDDDDDKDANEIPDMQ